VIEVMEEFRNRRERLVMMLKELDREEMEAVQSILRDNQRVKSEDNDIFN
jgi:hypothetical protein